MIVITGATGQLGSQIVTRLLERLPAEQIGVSVRDTEKASDLAARGVRVRQGDYTDPGSLLEAFEGAKQVFVVSSSSFGEQAVAQNVAAIDAARSVGAERIVYTSHQAAGAASRFAPMLDHAAAIEHLSTADLPFTALQHGFYASTVPMLLGDALESGEIVAPEDGPVSWTTHADLAEADAMILAEPGRFDGTTPPLTSPVMHDLEGIARILTEITGRTIRRVVAEDDEWVQGLVGHGVPQGQAEMLLGMFRASRRGEFAVVDPTLEHLLGRPAQSMRTVLEAVALEPVVAGS